MYNGDNLIPILLILATIKMFVFGGILYYVFRNDIQEWWSGKEEEASPPSTPVCMYCQSVWTTPVDEGRTQWDGEELVLVHAYECQHCRLPFWHVERVPVPTPKG